MLPKEVGQWSCIPTATSRRPAAWRPKGLVILSDTGDSVYGGVPGDNTCLLGALLERPIPCAAFVPMVDPVALQSVVAAGVSARISLQLGGKIDSFYCKPLQVTGEIVAVCGGLTVDLHDRSVCDLRQTALLQVGSVFVALLDHRSFAVNHPVLYTHLGLDVTDAKIVVVTTASNFQFFSRWRKTLIRVDTPGTTQSNLKSFDWQRLPRPIYPLDPIDGPD